MANARVLGTNQQPLAFFQDRSSRQRGHREGEEHHSTNHNSPVISDFDIFGSYTNENNPFGDPALRDVFVWHKKYEKELAQGKRTHIPSTKEVEAERASRVLQIASVKRRQAARDAERRERMRLRAEEDRLREAEGYSGSMDKEAAFHLSQTAQRTEIRIRDAREKLVDVLAKNLVVWARAREAETAQAAGRTQSSLANPLSKGVDGRNHMLDVVTDAPHVLLGAGCGGMAPEQLQELVEQVQQYIASEQMSPGGTDGHDVFLSYWQCVGVLVDDFLQRARARASGDTTHTGPGGVPATYAADIDRILGEKNLVDLLVLEAEVKQRAVTHLGGSAAAEGGHLAGVTHGVDGQFWVHALTAIGVYKAQARAKQLHDKVLMLRLGQLQRAKAQLSAEAGASASKAITAAQRQVGTQSSLQDDDDDAQSAWASSGAAAVPDGMSVAAAAAAGLGDAEEAAAGEEEVQVATPQQDAWQSRFKPRKPRFFHRVKTGWAWNKYNRAHYDKDTPPPKVVQGYKFTLFYPELINKFDTPTYHLQPADSPEFAIIRFHAGPPYQDVAFKIVNREWNVQPKQGFKCQFDKGVMQLWFQFKRDSYRR